MNQRGLPRQALEKGPLETLPWPSSDLEDSGGVNLPALDLSGESIYCKKTPVQYIIWAHMAKRDEKLWPKLSAKLGGDEWYEENQPQFTQKVEAGPRGGILNGKSIYQESIAITCNHYSWMFGTIWTTKRQLLFFLWQLVKLKACGMRCHHGCESKCF